MLWGRLDGAERIIQSVLPPGSSDAGRLVRDAHLAILRESFGEQAQAMYLRLKVGYEVDRRVGARAAITALLRIGWIVLKWICLKTLR
jgi:hypothetical protein